MAAQRQTATDLCQEISLFFFYVVFPYFFLFKNYWLLIHFEPVRHSYFCCSPEWDVLRHAHCGPGNANALEKAFTCFGFRRNKISNIPIATEIEIEVFKWHRTMFTLLASLLIPLCLTFFFFEWTGSSILSVLHVVCQCFAFIFFYSLTCIYLYSLLARFYRLLRCSEAPKLRCTDVLGASRDGWLHSLLNHWVFTAVWRTAFDAANLISTSIFRLPLPGAIASAFCLLTWLSM